MVVSTKTIVYVHELATGDDHLIQLPSACYSAIDVVRETVAILLLLSSYRRPHITTWTLSEKVAREFPITDLSRPYEKVARQFPVTDHSRSCRMMIDPLQSSVLYINGESLTFERYDLKGMQIAKGELQEPRPDDFSNFGLTQHVTFSSEALGIEALWYYQPSFLWSFSAMENYSERYDEDRRYEGRHYEHRHDEDEVEKVFPAMARYIFDLDLNKLRFEEFEEFRGTAHRVDKTSTFVFNGNAYTAYGIYDYNKTHLGCALIHGNETDCAKRSNSVDSCHPLEVVKEGLKGFWLLGDKKFLIRASDNGYAVFCFDPFIFMANEDVANNEAQVEALRKKGKNNEASKDQEEGNE
ncbi:hypothetical protein MMC14_004129 [Varicellaria rhodocarpa]|nr:hypothetical protein [Varicellaria rhodocarpa]